MHVPNGSKPVRRDKKSRLKALVFTAKSRVLAGCKTLASVKNSLPVSLTPPPDANSLGERRSTGSNMLLVRGRARALPSQFGPQKQQRGSPTGHRGIGPNQATQPATQRAGPTPQNGFPRASHRFRRCAPPRSQVPQWKNVPHGERGCGKVAQAAERGLVARQGPE